ncbi:MAG: NAD-dependent epimerase/dehydratase family protein [Oscillospiraceae bacterium]
MKILITGSNGFIGKNLIAKLSESSEYTIETFDSENTLDELNEYTKDCDFVFHFAAVHRPKDNSEFYKTNVGLTKILISYLEDNNNNCPILLTSSIQANDANDYGESKREAEKAVFDHQAKTGANAIVYRLTNTFGRWATPNSHSVVATFCYNTSKGLPISISAPEHIINLYYIDDVINDFVIHLKSDVPPNFGKFYTLKDEQIFHVTLGDLAESIKKFSENPEQKFTNTFEEHLYNTFISYK